MGRPLSFGANRGIPIFGQLQALLDERA